MKARALLMGVAVVLLAPGCGENRDGAPGEESNVGGAAEAPAVSYANISVEQLRAKMADGDPFLVNVHIPFEGDIPGTDASIAFNEIADHLDQLPQDRDADIVLYCRSGRMSAEAATTLASLGFTHVSNLEGGFRAWGEAGYEIQR